MITGTARTDIICGPLSCAGFGLAFMSIGLLFLCGDTFSRPLAVSVAVAIPFGFVLGVLGRLLDTRAHWRVRKMYRLPNEPHIGTPEERRDWFFAATVLAFLIFVLVMIVIHI